MDFMKPIAPKFSNTVNSTLDITKRTKEILNQYSKYTKYSEGEIVDMIASEIINDDKDFVEWLKTRRYKRKIKDLIFQENEEVELKNEETDETGDF